MTVPRAWFPSGLDTGDTVTLDKQKDVKYGKDALMRIYVQVPHSDYENADRATRVQEATKFTPPELKTYQYLTEKDS
ncbi:hypothetical protein PENCOP_c007G00539 [Penicillium coprophilum]|uniref:Uncharacterized protein n=1 Tax=Penicillium coprophilum TaxID=36646 RepID=A0A1V6UL60_9EURO|nr:hypothetical protein PENCOP_c007G00539 [Penicillium coprophilum]